MSKTWRFFVSAVVAWLRRKTSLFHFCGGRYHKKKATSLRSKRFHPKKHANIWRTERDGISAIKFEAARVHFLSDVFVAVAVLVA